MKFKTKVGAIIITVGLVVQMLALAAATVASDGNVGTNAILGILTGVVIGQIAGRLLITLPPALHKDHVWTPDREYPQQLQECIECGDFR